MKAPRTRAAKAEPAPASPVHDWNEPRETRPTRAMNLNLPEREVIDRCRRGAIAISATEDLLSGGTHLVCKTIEGADEARILFRRDVIEGRVRRASLQRFETAYLR